MSHDTKSTKRVVDTEKVMQMVDIGTKATSEMEPKELAYFVNSGLLDTEKDGDHISFIRIAGFIIGAALFTEKHTDGIIYLEVSRMFQAHFGSDMYITDRVMSEVESFALKNGIHWVSIHVPFPSGSRYFVPMISSMEKSNYYPVPVGKIIQTGNNTTLYDLMKVLIVLFKGYTPSYEHAYNEGDVNSDLIQLATLIYGKYPVENLSSNKGKKEFSEWSVKFDQFGKMTETGDDGSITIRFSKYLIQGSVEVLKEKMDSNDQIGSSESDPSNPLGELPNKSSMLLKMISPKFYNVTDKDDDEIAKMIGNVKDFVHICRGQVGADYVEKSILSPGYNSTYIITFEVGGMVLAFCTLEIVENEDDDAKLSAHIPILCSRPSIGLGSRILEAAEDFALKSGATDMYLEAVERRIDWYRTQGYKTSHLIEFGEEEEELNESPLMIKPLVVKKRKREILS